MPVPSVNCCSSFGTGRTVPVYISCGPDTSGVTGGLTLCQLSCCFSCLGVHQRDEDVEGKFSTAAFFFFKPQENIGDADGWRGGTGVAINTATSGKLKDVLTPSKQS